MGVTTQRRKWTARVAVVVVAAAAGVFGIAAPAFAANVGVDPTNINLKAGQSADITVTVSDIEAEGGGQVLVTVAIPNEVGNNATVQGIEGCSHPCIKNKQGDNDLTFRFRIRANANMAAGTDLSGVGTITARQAGPEPATTQFSLSVQGPDQQAPQEVPEVSGQVTDTGTGKGVAAAKVFLQDSAQRSLETGTDNDGKFRFTSKPGAPIAPGTVAIIVEREGYAKVERTEQAQAGVALRLGKIAIASTASASATPGATAPVGSDSAEPTLDGINPDQTAGNEEEAGLSWMLIGIGGLLVLLGIGAIVLLLVRRRDGDDDDDDEPGPRRGPPPGRAGPPRPPQPPRRGAPPERTAVMRGGPPPGHMGPPVSPGPRGADQTMIARSPLADMPTQMHRPLPADPDPYATRQNGAHAAPHYQAGYGPPAGPPPGQAGYGAPPPAGYPGGGPSYGHPDPQYGQPYPGGPAYPGGYEQPTYGQPYGQPPTSPYDPPAGYDPYDPRGQQRPPQQPPGNDGRRVDWLDD